MTIKKRFYLQNGPECSEHLEYQVGILCNLIYAKRNNLKNTILSYRDTLQLFIRYLSKEKLIINTHAEQTQKEGPVFTDTLREGRFIILLYVEQHLTICWIWPILLIYNKLKTISKSSYIFHSWDNSISCVVCKIATCILS